MYKVFINDKEIILTDKLPEMPAISSLSANIKNKKEFLCIIDDFLGNLHKTPDYYYILNENPDLLLSYLKDHMIYIEAAGGLVENPQNEILFIFRYGKWDLPKGKKEPCESPENTAIREVIEECGIGDIRIKSPLASTYHMYALPSNQWVLKQTFWYLMFSGDWENPTPQIEEDISKVVWVNPSNLKDYLSNTYASIRMLVQEHHTKTRA